MIKVYLKPLLRSLVKNRVYAGINIGGLAIGMAGAIVIFQLVSYHLSVDRYHKNANRTYRVVVDLHLEDGSVEREKGSAFVLHETLKKEFSIVENSAYLAHKELTFDTNHSGGARRFLEKEAAGFTNSNFFKIFDYQLISGDFSSLNEPNHVLLTERYARKYFGDADAMGKTLTVDLQENLVVTGILKDYPEQTDFKKDIFISLPTIKKLIPEYGYADWGWIDSNRETYITLQSPEQQKVFESQMPAFSNKYYGADGKIFRYHLQPLSDIHFNIEYGGKIKYYTIALLAAVGLLLILIACFNFINISTAQSLKRSKEVGVRKVLGISRHQLFWLFIQETAFYTLLSYLLAILTAWLVMPFVCQWLNIKTDINIFTDYKLLIFSLLLIVLITALAGVYPALIISNFNPVRAIKGISQNNGREVFSIRKALVVVQFVISFILISVSIVIILQSNYLKNKDLGQNKNLIMHLKLPEAEASKISTIKNKLMGIKDIANVSFFRTAPSSQSGGGGSIKFENREWEKFVGRSKIADDQYTKTYGLKLLTGRNPIPTDTVRELLVNVTMVKALGLKSPDEALGKSLLVGDIGKTGTIVGVLSDFNNTDLYSNIEPTVLFSSMKHYRNIAVKLNRFDAKTIKSISQIWQNQFPDNVFEYSFYDEEIASFYRREELASNLTATFAVLSVFLSCLGLFGLAIFSIEQRVKEIGIRKVLGASVLSVTALLSNDFLKLVCIAIIIASPVAYYFMDRWLQDFAYRIHIDWWIFAVSGILAIFIAFMTVGYHSVKAALMNPVNTLK